jgi:hypothetical protein
LKVPLNEWSYGFVKLLEINIYYLEKYWINVCSLEND